MESLLQQVQLLQMLGLHRAQPRGPGDPGEDDRNDGAFESDSDDEKVGEVSQGAQSRLPFGGHRGGRSGQGAQARTGLRLHRDRPFFHADEAPRPDHHDLVLARLEESGRLVAHVGVPSLPPFCAPEVSRSEQAARDPFHLADLRSLNARYHDRLAEFAGTPPRPRRSSLRPADLDRRLLFLEKYYAILEHLVEAQDASARPLAPSAGVPEKVRASSGARLMARQRRHLWSTVLTPDPPAAPAVPESVTRPRGTRGGLRRRLKAATAPPAPGAAPPHPTTPGISHRKVRQGGKS